MDLTINGSAVELDDRHPKTPLLLVLRDVLESKSRRGRRPDRAVDERQPVPKKYGANSWAAVKGYIDAIAAMPPIVHP
jgi:hypothetical protein